LVVFCFPLTIRYESTSCQARVTRTPALYRAHHSVNLFKTTVHVFIMLRYNASCKHGTSDTTLHVHCQQVYSYGTVIGTTAPDTHCQTRRHWARLRTHHAGLAWSRMMSGGPAQTQPHSAATMWRVLYWANTVSDLVKLSNAKKN
jgi:hypothetical protein